MIIFCFSRAKIVKKHFFFFIEDGISFRLNTGNVDLFFVVVSVISVPNMAMGNETPYV